VRVLALCPGPVPTGFQATAGIVPGMERVAVLSAKETVRRGLAAYEAGERVCIPGAVNRVQTLVSKLAPRAFVTGAIARAMRRMGRDQ
jgi:short-subunit dehydrogenase